MDLVLWVLRDIFECTERMRLDAADLHFHHVGVEGVADHLHPVVSD